MQTAAAGAVLLVRAGRCSLRAATAAAIVLLLIAADVCCSIQPLTGQPCTKMEVGVIIRCCRRSSHC
jgi:hypothetical protein